MVNAGCDVDSRVITNVKKPNIVFIITDDQSPFTLSAYGNEICNTPNIDRLVLEGMSLSSAYHMGSWRSAVCIPSRIQIMTGKHVWHTLGLATNHIDTTEGSVANDLIERNRNAARDLMPALFNQAGYVTFRTCKKGTSYAAANKLFKHNYERWCVHADDTSGSKWHGDRAVEFLDRQNALQEEKPFLIYMGFSHPHDPRHEKVEFYQKYGAHDKPPAEPNPLAPPLPINYLSQHPFRHGNDNGRDEVRVQGVMSRRDEATIRNEIGRNYACIENIDNQVGRVLEKLAEIGEVENTFIFFASDHGIAIGRHGLTGKQNLYEHSWRVPMIVKGPGIKQSSTAPGNIYLMDVLPTICEMTGMDVPSTCDGLSFLPVLRGEKEVVRDVLYGVFNIFAEHLGGSGNGSRPGIRAVRSGKWKLIKYDVYNGAVRETQLFNLETNPNELLVQHQDLNIIRMTGNVPDPNQVDLAEDDQFADKLEELEDLLLQEQKKYGDPYRLWNQIGK
ncbi:MAG: sulfatase-like hydrolase/transferase [Saprospiraceae bacterium]|nr:sulfatase-like hydrolase/transferase [Saprospiraceae bacterium]